MTTYETIWFDYGPREQVRAWQKANAEKQKQYEIDRFIYRQNHDNLTNQVMGRGKALAGIR